MRKLFYNKIAKGIVSLITIIILLSSILATSIFYKNNITGFAVSETITSNAASIQIQTVNDIKELNQLNEGWYEIRNGFVFYLDTFNSYVPLYIKVLNQEQQNGLLAVDEYGNIEFGIVINLLKEKEVVDEDETFEEPSSQITGEVTGLEGVSGYSSHRAVDRIRKNIDDYRRSIERAKKQAEEERKILARVEVDIKYRLNPEYHLRLDANGVETWYELERGFFSDTYRKLDVDPLKDIQIDPLEDIQRKYGRYGDRLTGVIVRLKDAEGKALPSERLRLPEISEAFVEGPSLPPRETAAPTPAPAPQPPLVAAPAEAPPPKTAADQVPVQAPPETAREFPLKGPFPVIPYYAGCGLKTGLAYSKCKSEESRINYLRKEESLTLAKIEVDTGAPFYKSEPRFELKINERTGETEWYEVPPAILGFSSRIKIEGDIGTYIKEKYGYKPIKLTVKDKKGEPTELTLSPEYLKQFEEQNAGKSLVTYLAARDADVQNNIFLGPKQQAPAIPQVPQPTVDDWKKQAEEWDEKRLSQNFGDYYVASDGFIWATDVLGDYVVAKADQNLFQKYKEKNVQVDLQGNVKPFAEAIPSTAPTVAAPETAPAPTPVVSPPPEAGKSAEDTESVWYKPWTWPLFRKEQKPAAPEPTEQQEAKPTAPADTSPAPATSLEQRRQEIKNQIQNLERQIDEKRRQGAESGEIRNLEIKIGTLKNIVPPSERYLELAKAAGILDSTAQKYYDGDVKQVKVQDLNWELRNKLGAKFQSGGANYEFRFNHDTYEYEIFAQGAKAPVSDLAIPSLLKNVRPSFIKEETPAVPATEPAAPPSVTPPEPGKKSPLSPKEENEDVRVASETPVPPGGRAVTDDTGRRIVFDAGGNIVQAPTPAGYPVQIVTVESTGTGADDIVAGPGAPSRSPVWLQRKTDYVVKKYGATAEPGQSIGVVGGKSVNLAVKNIQGVDTWIGKDVQGNEYDLGKLSGVTVEPGSVSYKAMVGNRELQYGDTVRTLANQDITLVPNPKSPFGLGFQFWPEKDSHIFSHLEIGQVVGFSTPIERVKVGDVKSDGVSVTDIKKVGNQIKLTYSDGTTSSVPPGGVILFFSPPGIPTAIAGPASTPTFTTFPTKVEEFKIYDEIAIDGVRYRKGPWITDEKPPSDGKWKWTTLDKSKSLSDQEVLDSINKGKLNSYYFIDYGYAYLPSKYGPVYDSGVGRPQDTLKGLHKEEVATINYIRDQNPGATPYQVIAEAFGKPQLSTADVQNYRFFMGVQEVKLFEDNKFYPVDPSGRKTSNTPITFDQTASSSSIVAVNKNAFPATATPQAVTQDVARSLPKVQAPTTAAPSATAPPKPEQAKAQELSFIDTAKAKAYNILQNKLTQFANNLDDIGYPKSETNKIRNNDLDAIQTAQIFMGFEGDKVNARVGKDTLGGSIQLKGYVTSILDSQGQSIGIFNPIEQKGVVVRDNPIKENEKIAEVFSGSLPSLKYYAGIIPLTDDRRRLTSLVIQKVKSIQNLNQLGEGLYFTENGVVYLFDESSGTTIPTFIQVENKDQQNTYFLVNYKGDIDIRRPLPKETTGVQPSAPPSLPSQQKQAIAGFVNAKAEEFARKEGRETPNEDDFKKGQEQYIKDFSSNPNIQQIKEFLTNEYTSYNKEPRFVEKAPPQKIRQVEYIELNDVQRQVLIEGKEAEILGSSNENGIYTVGEDVYLVDTQGNYVKLDYSPKHEAYVLPGTESKVDITYGSDTPPRSTQVSPTFVVPAPTIPRSLDTSNYRFNDGAKSMFLDKRTLQPCEKAGGNCVEVKPGEILFTGADSAAKPATSPKAPIPGAPIEPGKPLPPSKTETIPVLSTDGQVYILEVFKPAEGKQKLKFGDVDIEVPESLLKGVDLRKSFAYDIATGAISVTAPTGENREISKVGTTYVAIDKKYEEKKGLTKETKTEILDDSTTRITTTQNPNTNEQQINRKTVLPDGKTTVEIQFDKGAGDQDLTKAKVSVTADGRTSQFSGTALSALQEKNPTLSDENKRNQVLVAATRTGADLNKAGDGIVGDPNGVHIRFDNDIIADLRGNQVTGFYDFKTGERATIEGGAELLDTGNINLKKGAIVSITDKTGTIQRIIEHTSDNRDAVESKYNPDGSVTVKIGVYDIVARQIPEDSPFTSTYKLKEDRSDTKTYRQLQVLDQSNRPTGVFIERGILSNDVKVQVRKSDGTLDYISLSDIPENCNTGAACAIKQTFISTISSFGKKVEKTETKEEQVTIEGDLVVARSVSKVAPQLVKPIARQEEQKGIPSPAQETSQRFFAYVERVLTDFQGLGYYSTLFFDEDSLLKWRENVDRLFATLYLGTEYWSSSICGQYLDGEDEGIAWAETPQGLAQVAAHIEATRTEPIQTDKGQEFIYKITFRVRNGDYDKDPRAPEEMRINVILRGDRTATVFKQDQKVKRGSTFSRTGRSAIVQDSTAFYNEICMTFDKVPFRWKISNNEICNTVVESSGGATSVSTTGTSTPSSGGGGTTEGDVNDF